MSNPVKHDPAHDEMLQLLPWFVNQSLDSEQANILSKHIESCADCQSEIQLLRSVNTMARDEARNAYQTKADIERNLASVMNRVNAEDSESKLVSSDKPLQRFKLVKWLELLSVFPSVRWNTVALAGVLAVVIGLQWFGGASEDQYSVLSSSEITDSTVTLSMEIVTTLSSEQVQTMIRDTIEPVDQPVEVHFSGDNLFSIVLPESVSVEGLSRIIADLEQRPQIKRVEIQP